MEGKERDFERDTNSTKEGLAERKRERETHNERERERKRQIDSQ